MNGGMIDHDATHQLAALRAGTITARELMGETLDRIDKANPAINAIVALRDRDTLLAEAEGAPPGPLQGLPMAIKDLAETAGIVTTYGSPAFRDHVPAADSPMVARLRRAGAVIIGKTNTPEFGLGSHSYNPVYGVTRNPYDPTRSAGGSSGGAGAALASRMVALADGSDMMGSLRNPAGWNNVFGFRPSYGLVANGGPGDMFLAQLSTEGPMARSIRDLELLLAIQSEHDPRHPHSSGPYRPQVPGRKLRIGWAADWGGAYPTEPGVLDLCEAAMRVFEGMGHHVTAIKPPLSRRGAVGGLDHPAQLDHRRQPGSPAAHVARHGQARTAVGNRTWPCLVPRRYPPGQHHPVRLVPPHRRVGGRCPGPAIGAAFRL